VIVIRESRIALFLETLEFSVSVDDIINYVYN